MSTAIQRSDHVGSLAKGLGVMEILAGHAAGLTLTEVAERAGLTRAGARRLLLTLVASGYAAQEGRKFRLTPRLLAQARTWLDGSSLWAFAEPFMRRVAGALKESCSAAVLADEDIVYVARVPGERIISVALHVGTRLPAFCTSMGRVLLAGLPEAELRALLDRAAIEARTDRTVVDRDLLAGIVGRARRDGFCMVDQELEIGLRSIAVPVRDRAGRTVAAINVSAHAARYVRADMVERVLPLLKDAARDIEAYFVVQ